VRGRERKDILKIAIANQMQSKRTSQLQGFGAESLTRNRFHFGRVSFSSGFCLVIDLLTRKEQRFSYPLTSKRTFIHLNPVLL